MSSFITPLLRSPQRSHRLINRRNNAVVATVVTTAVDSRSRRRGLLGLNRMPDGQALIIAPCNAIHTWFMRFDIDVVFVTRRGEVIKRVDTVSPWRMAVAWRAFAVIELAAGALRASGTGKGDIVEVVPEESAIP